MDDILYSREKETMMINFEEQDKMEIIVEGIANGEIFINDEGIYVDAWDDPIFLEDVE
tara:strand:+ start:123 stop:296 length:174 start_codon:yes stop_codon:yes gene_type:complete